MRIRINLMRDPPELEGHTRPRRGGAITRALRLDLVGFGNVGRALATLLKDRSGDLPLKVVSIVTLRHGCWVDPGGIDLESALKGLPSKVSLPKIADLPGNVLVELTTLEPRTGLPAMDHVRDALRARKHVVTANKGPIAHGYAELSGMAWAARRQLRFEATLSDCLPVFNLRRSALPLAEIRRIRGVVSSTTNHILSAAARGLAFGDALAEAQRLGIAEADPRNDLEGWDAAAKATILANVLMDARIGIDDVHREAIDEAAAHAARSAAAEGARMRPLIEIVRRPSHPRAHHLEPTAVTATSGPRRLDPLDPLYAVDGLSMALDIETDLAGRVVVQLHDPHVEQVAYAVLTDLLEIAGWDA
jgi:homoserine dehydrogenase